ncbi:MAG TPA: outer membrane beta-barrel protein [Xanthobacteraceae bacterium]|nr:outer membrane beta-barrel protein [Xanthobacteraceae bacterium]
MNRLLLAGISLVGLSGVATAADMPLKAPPPPPVPAWSWTGFYAGLNGGYSFGRDPFMQNDPDQGGLFSQTPSMVTPRGGLFGGQLGYNWQLNHVVLGLEGDAQWAHQDSTSCAVTCFYDNITNEFTASTMRQKLDWFATARARVGWANDGYLLYVTGGPAWGRVSETDTLNFEILAPAAQSFARTLTGSAIGGGIEARVWGNWTAKVEYLHLNLGSMTNIANLTFQPVGPVAAGPFTLTTTSSVRDDIIRVGVNYKFAGTAIDPVPAAAALALPVKAAAAVWSWTGFYLGINGGYGVGSDPFSQMQLVAGTLLVDSTFMNAKVAPAGGLFGGQAGYNWQTGHVVLGIESDAQWTNQHGVSCGIECTAVGFAPNTFTTVDQRLRWLATVRGRLGWANDGYLLYVTGGGAFGGIDETDSLPTNPNAASFSQNRSGWTAGGGIEARLWGNWTGKLEYLHFDLGSMTNTFNYMFGGAPLTLSTTSAIRDDVVRAGLNYKIGG